MVHEIATRPADDERVPRARKLSPALLQRRVRQLHLYASMLFAPSLLFFAVTGALQLFDLHEVKPGRAFEPPAVLQELGMVHKKQVFALPRRRPPSPVASDGGAAPGMPQTPASPPGGRADGWEVLGLRIFFLLASIGLLLSTCLGIWIGVQPNRNRSVAVGLLAAGAAIPVLLLAL
jgi:hypothetical protein